MIANLPKISALLEYGRTRQDWDDHALLGWPALICDDLECADKQYLYRPDGEHWELFSLSLTGEEEWKATAETETMAIAFMAVLSNATQEA